MTAPECHVAPARLYLHASQHGDGQTLCIHCVKELFREAGNLMRSVIPEPYFVTRVASSLHRLCDGQGLLSISHYTYSEFIVLRNLTVTIV